MKTLITLIFFLSITTAVTASISNDSPALDFHKARQIHVKKTYLKKATKQLALIEKKIALLKEKSSTKKNQDKITSLIQRRYKIKLWQKDVQYTQDMIKALIKSQMTNGLKAEGNRRKIKVNYEKLTGEKYPLDFDKKVGQVYMTLTAKRKASASSK